MSHTLHLSTKNVPGDLDKTSCKHFCINHDASKFFTLHPRHVYIYRNEDIEDEQYFGFREMDTFVTICRHDILLDETSVFDWGQRLLDIHGGIRSLYSLTDELIVIVTINDNKSVLYQFLVQLVPPSQLPSSGYSNPKKPLKPERGVAWTTCVRRRTITDIPRFGIAHVGSGLLAGGMILICGSYITRRERPDLPNKLLELIAANPLTIDRYPDRSLTGQMVQLSRMAEQENSIVGISSPICTPDAIFFWMTEGDTAKLRTDMIAVLYLADDIKQKAQLLSIDNSELPFVAEQRRPHIRNGSVVGSQVFVQFAWYCGDAEPSRTWWSRKKEEYSNSFILWLRNVIFRMRHLDNGRCLRWMDNTVMPLYSNEYPSHSQHDIFVLDLAQERFRRIEFQPLGRNDKVDKSLPFGVSADGALMAASLPSTRPFECPESFQNSLHVTLMSVSRNPPTLQTICERAVLRQTVYKRCPRVRGLLSRMRSGVTNTRHVTTDARQMPKATWFAETEEDLFKIV